MSYRDASTSPTANFACSLHSGGSAAAPTNDMTSTTPGDPSHPRPQLQRERWISLDGPWRFAFDPDRRWHRPADIDEWPLTIRVPFAPESKLSGIGDTGFHPVCWYEREFDLPDLPPKGRLLLHIGAVDYQ